MANSPIQNRPQPIPEEKRKPAECPPDSELPENSQENLDAKLDHAIEETFPTSDPVSVSITKGGAIDHESQEAASSAEPGRQNQQAQGRTAESLLDQATDTLRDAAGSASAAARDAYDQGKRYARQAAERYPEAERYYQEGSRAISQRMAKNPWLSLFVAGAVGYGLAWIIHGRWDTRRNRVPDYARTKRGYAPHRDDQRGL
jgi:ElaB/YqjD/DUF883 family membrane-anchored ribosome-binding protein